MEIGRLGTGRPVRADPAEENHGHRTDRDVGVGAVSPRRGVDALLPPSLCRQRPRHPRHGALRLRIVGRQRGVLRQDLGQVPEHGDRRRLPLAAARRTVTFLSRDALDPHDDHGDAELRPRPRQAN